jgi:uncharacterized membrane protein
MRYEVLTILNVLLLALLLFLVGPLIGILVSRRKMHPAAFVIGLMNQALALIIAATLCIRFSICPMIGQARGPQDKGRGWLSVQDIILYALLLLLVGGLAGILVSRKKMHRAAFVIGLAAQSLALCAVVGLWAGPFICQLQVQL